MSYEVEVGRFVTIPVKRTNDVDLVKPLETFIRNTYDKVNSLNYEYACLDAMML